MSNAQDHLEDQGGDSGGFDKLELERDEGDGVDVLVVQDRGEAGAGESGEGRRGKIWYRADSCE